MPKSVHVETEGEVACPLPKGLPDTYFVSVLTCQSQLKNLFFAKCILEVSLPRAELQDMEEEEKAAHEDGEVPAAYRVKARAAF